MGIIYHVFQEKQVNIQQQPTWVITYIISHLERDNILMSHDLLTQENKLQPVHINALHEKGSDWN